MKDTVKVLKFVMDFLDQLSESELNDVINDKIKLKVEYKYSEKNTNNKQLKEIDDNSDEIKDICDNLETMLSREVAMEYLQKLNITKANLKSIANKYNIPITTKDTNGKLISKIVEGIVGSKLRFHALLDTNLD